MDNFDKIKRNKEFWDVDKAVKRLIYKFSPNEKGLYPYFRVSEHDFNAFKSILGSLDRNKKLNVLNHSLFAKLYIYNLHMAINHFGTTVLDGYPHQDLHNKLRMPLGYFYKAFHSDLHLNQLNKLNKKNDTEKNNDIIKEFKQLQKTFTLEFVSSTLEKHINECLQAYE